MNEIFNLDGVGKGKSFQDIIDEMTIDECIDGIKCLDICCNRAEIVREKAIQILQEKLQRDNPHRLTLAQLQKMNGQAVFCVDAKGKGKWALVHVDNEMCTDADFGDWEFYEYGHNSPYGWKAYKTEPKHIGEATNMVEGEKG